MFVSGVCKIPKHVQMQRLLMKYQSNISLPLHPPPQHIHTI